MRQATSTVPPLFAAVGAGGIFKSTDGGAHWVGTNSGIPAFAYPNVAALGVDPQHAFKQARDLGYCTKTDRLPPSGRSLQSGKPVWKSRLK